MDFIKYFKPSKTNLSLTAIILASQVLTFTFSTLLTAIISPEWMTEPMEPQPLVDAILFGGFLTGNYIAACSANWWINEHLKD